MSKESILIVFLIVVAELRGDGPGRYGRYGIESRNMSKVGTGPRPLLSAPSKHLAPQEEVTLQDPPSPGFISMGPILTHPGIDRDVLNRRNAEFDSVISGLKDSFPNLLDFSDDLPDPFQSSTRPKKRISIPIGGSDSEILPPSTSRRFSDPPSSPSPYSSSYPSPPSPPEPQVKAPISPWFRSRSSITEPSTPTPPPPAPSPPPTPSTPPSRFSGISNIVKRLGSLPRPGSQSSPSFDAAPPASCAASESNANPSVNQYRRSPSLGRSKTLPSEVDIEPNIMEPYPSPKSSSDSKPPSNSGSPSSNYSRFSNPGNKSNGPYNGSSNTKRYGGSTVVSDKLPNDSGTIEIKISGRQIDDERMSQMIKEAENAITSVFYYPMHESIKRGSISFQKAPQSRMIEL